MCTIFITNTYITDSRTSYLCTGWPKQFSTLFVRRNFVKYCNRYTRHVFCFFFKVQKCDIFASKSLVISPFE